MFNELEEKLKELDGIISCRITGDEEIDEIHIIASKNREAKRIVRDIETMVMVNLNKEIDHKKISIAQLNQNSDNVPKNRVEIITIYQENNRPFCYLKLNINDNLIEEEIGGSSEEPLPLIVVRGLLNTIEKYTNFNAKFRVENVFTTGINNEIIIVQLILYAGGKYGQQERLLGAAYINNNLPLAAGKACLKALNRRINTYV
jgi:hypothetical protein